MASGVGVAVATCGLQGASGVTAITVSGQAIDCGTDANGNQLVLQVNSTLVAMDSGSMDSPTNGVQVGLDIGGAVLLVLATAWGARALRNMLSSSADC